MEAAAVGPLKISRQAACGEGAPVPNCAWDLLSGAPKWYGSQFSLSNGVICSQQPNPNQQPHCSVLNQCDFIWSELVL